MKFAINPQKLVSGMQRVIGVVERRLTLPILANVLCSIDGQKMRFTATDLEVEIEHICELDESFEPTEFTIPGHKFYDICKSLSVDTVYFCYENQKVSLKTESAHYTLASLPAADFPNIEQVQPLIEFNLSQRQLKQLLNQTQFAMADQDVRFYLNGMLLQVAGDTIHAVAMDGHRFAHAELILADTSNLGEQQVLVPFKGIIELNRLLENNNDPITIKFCSNYLWVEMENLWFRSKLIDGVFPDYNLIMRNIGQQTINVEKKSFKQALSRLAILASSQLNAVRVEINAHSMKLLAINQESDEAWEKLSIQYQGEPTVLGFNIKYLLDMLAVIEADTVSIQFSSLDKGVLFSGSDEERTSYIIMPLRL